MRRQAGAPLFYFYKERLGTGSPPHPTRLRRPTYGLWWLRLDLTEQSPGLFDPQGEGFGGWEIPCRVSSPLPSNGLAREGTSRRVPPAAAGGKGCNHVLTGSAGQNILLSRQCARRARAADASPNFGRGLTPSRISDTPVHCPPERSSVPACPSQNSPAEVF